MPQPVSSLNLAEGIEEDHPPVGYRLTGPDIGANIEASVVKLDGIDPKTGEYCAERFKFRGIGKAFEKDMEVVTHAGIMITIGLQETANGCLARSAPAQVNDADVLHRQLSAF